MVALLRGAMTRSNIAIALQSVGLSALSVGVGLYNLAAGVIVAGLSAVLFGVAIERGE